MSSRGFTVGLVTSGILVGGLITASNASAQTPSPGPGKVQAKHHITCGWWAGPTGIAKGTPWSPKKGQVRGYALVRCSDKLDEAHTEAQIQYLSGTKWKNVGSPKVSYSTGTRNDDGTVSIYVLAVKSMPSGSHKYRTKMNHFGQHGNIWTLPTHYSPTRYLRN
ncbi:hypothetical protein GCM10009527_027660 [Actinomadura nitritigenes]|uniref:Secreted protein n=1 Tax=Actinomadura nitritigenes TaxID=134602 RepID=A0ABS3REG1_9ACTN|nr:hypothetical protein [Actinomadura nitritigenes]MBO2443993.1 hypothetical protein [Actinomadura nitritigenes]